MITSPSKLSEIYRAIGERIRDERRRRNISQEDLAFRIGLTRTSITNIEKGRQRMLLHTVVEIANVLGSSPSQLMSPFEKISEPALPSDISEPIRSWVLSSLSATRVKDSDQ